MHLWSWESLCKPKQDGVGIRKIDDLCETPRPKLAQTCCATNSLWASWRRDESIKNINFWMAKASIMVRKMEIHCKE